MSTNADFDEVLKEFPELEKLAPRMNMRGIIYYKNEGWMKHISLRIPMSLYIKLLLRRVMSRRTDNQEVTHLLEFAIRVIQQADQQAFDAVMARLSREDQSSSIPKETEPAS